MTCFSVFIVFLETASLTEIVILFECLLPVTKGENQVFNRINDHVY